MWGGDRLPPGLGSDRQRGAGRLNLASQVLEPERQLIGAQAVDPTLEIGNLSREREPLLIVGRRLA
jgi:hypothetical protein